MGKLHVFAMALASIWNFLMPVSMAAVNPNCDLYQDMVMGQEYYIYNAEYPLTYSASTACRWAAHSAAGTKIVLACEDVEIPSSTNCNGDRLAVSRTGNANLADAHNYCGNGSFSLVSEGNSLVVGLFSTSYSVGGRFVCTLTAIQDETSSSTEGPSVCDCGWKDGTRIVGGHETGVNEYPSMAGLVDLEKRDVYCGASIISNRYVLTAAHCVLNRQASNIGVLVGDHNVSSGYDTAQAALHAANAFETHPNYNSETQINDLAIIQTKTQIKFSLYVGPVCLPFRYTTMSFYGQTVKALGWGQLEYSGPKSDTLQEVELTITSNNDCASQHDNPITPYQICTYAPGKDACQSDSGGPLLWMDTSTRRLQLLGVISYGLGCATLRPGVNTRVTSYLSWIISRTSDASYCIK